MANTLPSISIGKLKSHRTKTSILFREVCERLRHHVTSLEPGAKLSEITLSEQLGISRTPVREALIQLSNEGLVQFRGNGRCHVATLTKQDVIEMADVRIGLEATAARALARTIQPDQLAELNKLALAADRAERQAKSRAEWDSAEEAFHQRLVELAGNTRIIELLQRQGLLERLLTLPMSDNWRRFATKGDPGHKMIVEALATGDPEQCDRIVRSHTEIRKQHLLETFEEMERASNGQT
jgi:DNA-binding GntR family transcriptional regulator